MNKIIVALYFFLSLCISTKADWYEIDAWDKVINFSSVAKYGKVSIFILSTSWCVPCKILKDVLKNQNYDMSKVDIYIINMAPEGHTFEELKKTKSFKIWQGIEGLKSWPTVYITNQINNIKAVFNDKGDDDDLISRINRIVNSYLENQDYYNENSILPVISNEKVLSNDYNYLMDSISNLNRLITDILNKDSSNYYDFEVFSEKGNQKALMFNSYNIQFYIYKNIKTKKESKTSKLSPIELTIFSILNYGDSTENFKIRIKDLDSLKYIALNDSLGEILLLKNGENVLKVNIDFGKKRVKNYRLEILRNDFLSFKKEYIIRK